VAGVIAVVCLTVLFLLGRHAEAMQRRLRAALEILPDRFAHKLDEVVEAFIQGASSARSQHFVFLLFAYTVLEWTV